MEEKYIEDVALRLPELPPRIRKNLYDILGVKRKETINSKVLAYFFDANEEHGFNNLFFDSLKNVIKNKSEKQNLDAFEGGFIVETEVSTIYSENENDKRKRIDIAIEGADWCIIIENKLYHELQNPLDTYWQHFHKKFPDYKIGIVLSLFEVPSNELIVNNIEFINVTHQELIEEIQKNFLLNEYSTDIDIFYLREYIKTISSHHPNKKNQDKMNKIVQVLIKQRKNIENIENTKKGAIEFIKQELDDIFARKGFNAEKKGFYFHPKNKNLRFWVNQESIITENYLWFCFEIMNSEKNEIENLISDFKKLKLNNIYIKYGTGDANNSGLVRLVIYDNNKFFIDDGDYNFREKFEIILNDYYFNAGGIIEKTEIFFDINRRH